MAMEVGRVCVKLFGREAGHKCIVLDVLDKSFLLITGPKELTGVKRRRVNIKHLELTDMTVKIIRGASDEEVMNELTRIGKLEEMKFGMKPPL